LAKTFIDSGEISQVENVMELDWGTWEFLTDLEIQ